MADVRVAPIVGPAVWSPLFAGRALLGWRTVFAVQAAIVRTATN